MQHTRLRGSAPRGSADGDEADALRARAAAAHDACNARGERLTIEQVDLGATAAASAQRSPELASRGAATRHWRRGCSRPLRPARARGARESPVRRPTQEADCRTGPCEPMRREKDGSMCSTYRGARVTHARDEGEARACAGRLAHCRMGRTS